MDIYKKKSGISLIVLIVCIVVIMILAGISIFVLTSDARKGAYEASFKTELKAYDEEIKLAISDYYLEDKTILQEVIFDEDKISQFSPNLVNSRYKDMAYISEGVLTLRSNKLSQEEKDWAQEVDIKIDNISKAIEFGNFKIVLNTEEWTKEDVIATFDCDNLISNYDIFYKLGDAEEYQKTSNKSTINIAYNTNIEAYIYSEEFDHRIGSLDTSKNVTNIDKVNPTEIQNIEVEQHVNSLKVRAVGSTDTLSGLAGYKYSKDNITWSDLVLATDTYEFNNLKSNTNYTIYAKAIDKVSLESPIKQIDVKTLKIEGELTFTQTPTGITGDSVKAKLSFSGTLPSEYKIQYKIENDVWKDGTEVTVDENTKIYGRIYNEEIDDELENDTYIDITNIDNVEPTAPTSIQVTSTLNTLTVRASGSTDSGTSESAVYGYKYSIDNNTWSDVVLVGSSYTFINIKADTTKTIYAKAVDKVTLESTVYSQNAKTNKGVGNVAINLSTTEWSVGPITATFIYANVPTGYAIEYKLGNSVWKAGTTASIDSNMTVYARLYNSLLDDEICASTKDISKIDLTAPTVPQDIEITPTKYTLEVKATGSNDVGRGVIGYKYSIDDGVSWSDVIEVDKTYTFNNLPTLTTKTIHAKATDGFYLSEAKTKQGTTLPETYIVKFDANGGSGEPTEQIKTQNQELTLSTTIPVKVGYDFAGWSTSKDNTVEYASGAKYTENSAITLYAVWTAKTVVVTFNRNFDVNDTTTATQTFTYGVSGQKFSDKGWNKTGYELLGWNESREATSRKYTTLSGVSNSWIDSNSPKVTLYAIWKANGYTVKYNGNGATSGSTADSTHIYDVPKALTSNGYSRKYTVTCNYNGSGKANSSATLTYTFDKWNTLANGTGTSYTNSQSVTNLTTTPDEIINLYAQWSTNGITISSPVREGYIFGGWYAEPECTTQVLAVGQKYSTPANKTIYAKWTAKSTVVTFNRNVNASDTTTATQTFTYDGNNQTITAKGWTNTGYNLSGWSDVRGDTTPKYEVFENMPNNFINDNYPSVTLYAVWAPNTYTVKYNGNGATAGSTADSTHTYGVAKTLTPNGYTRSYAVTYNYNGSGQPNSSDTLTFTFDKWNTKQDGTGTTSYTNSQSVTNLMSTAGGIVNLYAQWTTQGLAVNTPVREGYTFAGWYNEAACTTQVVAAGSKYTLGESKTIYAKWVAKTYTLTVDPNGGSWENKDVSQDFTGNVGTTKTISNPVKPGSNFVSWIPTKEELGATWAQVFYHNNKFGTVLYASDTEAQSSNEEDKFSILGQLENIKGSLTNYEFLLQYTDLSGYNRWTQTSNPVTTTAVTGYTAKAVSWTSNSWAGLAKSSINNSTFIDGSPSASNWFYAIGSKVAWSGGIPGATASVKQAVTLWQYVNSDLSNITTPITGVLDSNNNYIYKSQNITLKPAWVNKTYTLAYDLAGGTSVTNPTSYNVDTATITLNSSTTKTGYTFDGWTEQIVPIEWTSGFINLTNGKQEDNSTSYYSDMLLLKANNTYTLSGNSLGTTIRWRRFNLNGVYTGNVSNAMTYTPTEDCYIRVLLCDATTEVNRSTAIITKSGTLTTQQIPTGTTGNRKYTANWKINSYTLTINPNGGTWNGATTTQTKNLNYGSTLAIPVPTRTGYIFSGWTFVGETSKMTSLTAAATFTMGNINASLTANWVKAYYQNTTSKVYYKTLKDAVNGSATNTQINVIDSVTEVTTATVASGKALTLNMNDKNITFNGAYGLTNSGTLTLTGIGTLKGSQTHTIYNTSTGTLNIKLTNDYGIITNTSNINANKTIRNDGTITMTSGVVSNSVTTADMNEVTNTLFVVTNSGTFTLNGGKILATSSDNALQYGVYTSGTFNVNGGTVDVVGTAISSGGTANVTINGGTIQNGGTANTSGRTTIYHDSTGLLKITGGSITNKINQSVFNNNTGTVEISGTANILAKSNTAIYNKSTGIVNIKAGEIKSEKYDALYNHVGGTINVSGGSLIGKNMAINNGGSGILNVTGGTLTGTTYEGIKVLTGTLTLGSDDGSVSTTVPSITGKTYGVTTTTGTLKFYDGKISGATAISTTNAILTPSDYTIKTTVTDSIQTAILSNSSILTVDPNGGTWNSATTSQQFEQNVATTKVIANPTRTGYEFMGWLPTKVELGETWAEVFYHNNKSGTVLFTATDDPLSINNVNKFSLLGQLDKIKGNLTNYEFLLQYNEFTGYNRWTQTSNPATTTAVTGYTAGSVSWTGNGWGGLAKSSSTAYTFIDGSPSATSWFYSIGCKAAWSGGIPALSGTTASKQRTNLWLKVNSDLTNITESITGVLDGSNNYTYRPENITLKAIWKPKTIEVTFKRNTTSSDTTTATQTFTYGVANQSITAKGWTKTGYTLNGWSLTQNGARNYTTLSGITDSWINTNSPAITLYAVWIDNIKPTVPTAITTTSTVTSISAKASGSTDAGSGLAGYQYSIDGTNWTTTIANGTAYTFNNLTPNITYTIRARAIDNKGNVSTEKTTQVTVISFSDTTINCSTTAWTNANVTVTLTYPGTLPTGYSIYYYIGETSSGKQVWRKYSSAITIENNLTIKTGIYNSTAATINIVGDEPYRIVTKDITNIDKSNPTKPTSAIIIKADGTVWNISNWSNSYLYFYPGNISGSTDVGSGIARYEISYDNVNWYSLDYYTAEGVYRADTATTRYFRAVDNAGNASNSLAVSVLVDITAPTAPTVFKGVWDGWINFDLSNWSNKNVYLPGQNFTTGEQLISGSTDTNGSGVAKYQISNDSIYWYDLTVDGYNAAIDNHFAGVYAVYYTETSTTRYYRAIDNAGNASEATEVAIKIDTTAPSATSYKILNVSTTGYDIYIYGVSDLESGVNRVLCPTWTAANGQDDLIWHKAENLGNGTYHFRINKADHKNESGIYATHVYLYDNVGNAVRIYETTANIKQVPEIKVRKYSSNVNDNYPNFQISSDKLTITKVSRRLATIHFYDKWCYFTKCTNRNNNSF